jgi:hypothetical protein
MELGIAELTRTAVSGNLQHDSTLYRIGNNALNRRFVTGSERTPFAASGLIVPPATDSASLCQAILAPALRGFFYFSACKGVNFCRFHNCRYLRFII